MFNTLVATLAAGKNISRFLPAGVKAPSIDEDFDGKKIKVVQVWVERTRKILSMSGFKLDCTDTVRYASSILTGHVLTWIQFKGDRARPDNKDNTGFKTFDAYAAALIPVPWRSSPY
jgi:hypothetical protein